MPSSQWVYSDKKHQFKKEPLYPQTQWWEIICMEGSKLIHLFNRYNNKIWLIDLQALWMIDNHNFKPKANPSREYQWLHHHQCKTSHLNPVWLVNHFRINLICTTNSRISKVIICTCPSLLIIIITSYKESMQISFLKCTQLPLTNLILWCLITSTNSSNISASSTNRTLSLLRCMVALVKTPKLMVAKTTKTNETQTFIINIYPFIFHALSTFHSKL